MAIVGDGGERDNLLQLCDELLIRDRVQLVGRVRDVESWMARAGLIVQPSRYEGFPNVLLESMSTGAAVISTDCPSGPAEIIEDGINGKLVSVDSVDELASTMGDLMSRPSVRSKLGREATLVREHYRIDKIMAQWERCLFA